MKKAKNPIPNIYEELEAALKRLQKRGDKPPWEEHPRKVVFALYAADELSRRTRLQFEAHINNCSRCRAKVEPKRKKEPPAKCGICRRRLIPGDGGTYCMTCQYRMDHDSR